MLHRTRDVRIGNGYDSHRLVPDRRLILGGVEVPYEKGLTGHSDADVVAHAVTDALLGAAALGDIGTHFPPDDPSWKDADSIELLSQATEILAEHGYETVNVDVTVICEAPRLAPYTAAMRERLAEAVGVTKSDVSVKATTNETMGWIGRGEGVAALAVALIDRPRG